MPDKVMQLSNFFELVSFSILLHLMCVLVPTTGNVEYLCCRVFFSLFPNFISVFQAKLCDAKDHRDVLKSKVVSH